MRRYWWAGFLAVLVAAGTAARWRAATAAGPSLLDVDEPIYLHTALNARRLGVLGPEPAIPSPERMPIVPAWIALSQGGLGPVDALGARKLQAALSGAGVLLFFLLGVALDENRRAWSGLIAAGIFALHPDFRASPAVLRTEWMDLLLTALVALFGILWVRGPTARSSLCFGLSIGAALMSRSFLFLLLPALALMNFQRRKTWLPPLLFGALIPITPWIARNALQFRSLIAFERGAAEPSLYYSSLGMPGSKGLSAYEAMATREHPELLRLDTVARRKEMARYARENILAQPGRFLAASLRRLPVIWSRHAWFLLFAFVSFFLSRRRREARLLAGLWGYYNLHMFVDIHLLRLHPGLVPLLGLCVLGALEAPGLARRFPSTTVRLDAARWGLPAGFVLLFPAWLFLAREGFSVSRMSSPEPKVFLDRVVSAARAGNSAEALGALERGAADYPTYAALQLTHAALLESAGRSSDACLTLNKADGILSPLGEARGELGERISASLSACN